MDSITSLGPSEGIAVAKIAPTKKCYGCGQVLPVTSFYRSSRAKDGYQNQCIDCKREYERKRNAQNSRLKAAVLPIKGEPSSPLAQFTPQQLIDELKSRGFHGELRFVETHVVKV